VIAPLVSWSYTTNRTNRGQMCIFVTGACRWRLACYIPRSLCRNRLRDAKRKSRWLNALKSLDQAECCGPKPAAGTCLLQRAQSGSDNSRRLQLSMLLTKIGLKKTCRSIEGPRIVLHLPDAGLLGRISNLSRICPEPAEGMMRQVRSKNENETTTCAMRVPPRRD